MGNDAQFHAENIIYKKLVNEIPALIFQFIVSTNNCYTVHFMSAGITEILEMPNDSFNLDGDKNFYQLVHPEDRISFFASFSKSRKTLVNWALDFRIVLPNQEVKWLKIVAKPELINNGDVTFYGVITHIAAADTQDEKLKIANKRNQFALEASSLGVWDWDVVNNKVFYSSESMRILEIESVDLFDKSERWDDIVHPDDLEAYYENIKEHFAGNTAYYENYHRVLTTQGKYKWILDRGKVIEWDSEGKPLRIIGTHTDISDQKEKELELVKTTNLFSEQNKRLVNFSHIVSHNLYSHASNIKMLLDFVEAEKDQTEKDSVLAHLRTVSNDLNETISNLSEIIDIQNNINITKEAIRVNSFLNRILATLSMTKSQNNVSIVNKIPEDAFVLFNPAYLESVLLNFTTNAIKYAHPERNLEIEYDFYSQQNKKVLTITDNGLGIDLVRHGESLFGLYKTFHRHRDSRGIGLYITKNQIEAMNGTVEVESTVGLGTTFKVIFAEERIL